MHSKNQVIAIGIAFHSKAQRLYDAAESALSQNISGYEVQVVVLDSSPSRCALQLLHRIGSRDRLHIVHAKARSAYTARNHLISYAEKRWPDLCWHVRLDADDRFASLSSLSLAMRHVSPTHRIVLAGNRQMDAYGKCIGRNMPSARLLHKKYLLTRLAGMASGVFGAELPSCNLILKGGFEWRYPAKRSAEDHWLLASLLLRMRREWICLSKVELVDYRVGGSLTQANQRRGHYQSQRKKLLEAAIIWCKNG